MKPLKFILFCLILLIADIISSAAAVEFRDLTWRDLKRDRDVPVRIYFDPASEQPQPVIFFSHGLGGNRSGYEFLVNYWSKAGFAVVMVEHLGSNTDIFKSKPFIAAFREAAKDPLNAINRPKDISFAVDTLIDLNQNSKDWKNRFDPQRMGIGGHSFGAYTAMAAAGFKIILPDGKQFKQDEPRLRCALVLSEPVQKGQKQYGGKPFEDMNVPCFYMTGTKDKTPILAETLPEDRRWPFDHSRNERFLLTFNGGDHMIFSGRYRVYGIDGLDKPTDKLFQRIICETSLTFFEAFVNNNPEAQKKMRTAPASLGITPEIGVWESGNRSEDAAKP